MTTKYYKYTSDSGTVGRTMHRGAGVASKTTVDPDAEVSTAPGAPLFEISESRRSFGLRPRHVELVRVNTDTGTIVGTRRVAVATIARFNAIAATDTFDIGGQTWRVRRKVAEEFGV